ncbi:MAG: hypothetical protein K2O70_07995 [Desulfovibrionaceae bacterium]|nr:hypothetical protein [Desulfovibrionaceae bacterium]
MKKFPEEARAAIHSQLDAMLNLDNVDGFMVEAAVFHDDAVKTFQFGNGNVSADDQMLTKLNMMIDQCRQLGTRNALLMINPLLGCVSYLEKLHDITLCDTTGQICEDMIGLPKKESA